METNSGSLFSCYGSDMIEVIQLTSPSFSFQKHNAALARRALEALKGVLKLQALVRGHNVRRRTKMTLKCMQALFVTSSESFQMKEASTPTSFRVLSNQKKRSMYDAGFYDPRDEENEITIRHPHITNVLWFKPPATSAISSTTPWNSSVRSTNSSPSSLGKLLFSISELILFLP
uniref:DUF4005 domain-containing protein n=1 Tax=Lactuca sativa TaxID=4236 RepID=A0A9R1WJ10_LACSA|nr:hypothetical protein LSAT_V11C100009240 [Lactuca sativa]